MRCARLAALALLARRAAGGTGGGGGALAALLAASALRHHAAAGGGGGACATSANNNVSTIAGRPPGPRDAGAPISVAVSPDGLILVASAHSVAALANDELVVLANTTSATAVAASAGSDQSIYFADTAAVYRVDAAGAKTLVAGAANASGSSGDGGPATSALFGPLGRIEVTRGGDLYIADSRNHAIPLVTAASGAVSTYAGRLGVAGNGGNNVNAVTAILNQPNSARLSEAQGSQGLYVVDSGNHCIRRVYAGDATTVAGVCGASGDGGDGGAATSALLSFPFDIAITPGGDIYISENSYGGVIRVVKAGVISRFAGGPQALGNGGLALRANLFYPSGIALTPRGDLVIADQNNNQVRVVSQGVPTHQGLLGPGYITALLRSSETPDGGQARNAALSSPHGIALTRNGDVIFSEAGNNVIRRIALDTTVLTTVCGQLGVYGDTTSDGPALSARFNYPTGIAVDAATGTLAIADTYNGALRVLNASTGFVLTVHRANSAFLPYGVSFRAGDIFFSSLDPYSSSGGIVQVWRADTRAVTLLVGAGSGLQLPFGIAVSPSSAIYIADAGARVVFVVSASGNMSVFAGRLNTPGASTGGAATAARLSQPVGLAFASTGDLYVTDVGAHVLYRVDAAGNLSVALGTVGVFGSLDGKPTAATLWNPTGVAVGACGEIFVGGWRGTRCSSGSAAPPPAAC